MPSDWGFTHPDPTVGTVEFADLAVARDDGGIGWLAATEGGVVVRRVEHEYPGADGIGVMLLGRRTQTFAVSVLLVAADDSALELLMARLRQAQDGRTGTLTMRASGIENRMHCELASAPSVERKGGADGSRYMWVALTFRKLAPDAPGWWTGLQGA